LINLCLNLKVAIVLTLKKKVVKIKCNNVVKILHFKPWPNGVASYHKLKTFIDLRWFAMTCVNLIKLKFALK